MTSSSRQPRRLIARDDLQGDDDKVAALLAQVAPPRSTKGMRARVWARLNTQKPRRPYLMAAISGASLAVAIGLTVRALEPKAIALVSGADVVIEKSRVKTESSGRVALSELVMVDLLPNTELLASTDEGRISIELLSGGIVATPLAGEAPRLRVASRPYFIEGDGVRTRMVRINETDIEIEVFSGEAVLSTPEGKRRLHAGDKFESAPKMAAAPIEETQAIVEEPAVEEPKPKHEPRKRRAPRSKPVEQPKLERPKLEPEVTEPPKKVEPPEVTPEIPAPIDWEALYRQARAERDPAIAIPMFDRLAKSGSAWAEVSAFQAARLEMLRNRCQEAVDRFMTMMGGTYDSEARLDVIECQLKLSDLVSAQRSLDNFLRIHPESERQADLRFLRAELMRKRGRCSDAIADYQAAESSRRADDAMYFGAWCMLDVGKTEDGLTTLRRYLEKFPEGRHAGEAKKKL